MNPEQIRTAQIQRQHSQEMALRYLAIVTKEGEVPSMDVVVGFTDDFERDIQNAVAFREARPKLEDGGEVNGVEVITLDRAIALKEKIEGAPDAMKPMLGQKMVSLGMKPKDGLDKAIAQLTPVNADKLEDYMDSQFDAGEGR